MKKYTDVDIIAELQKLVDSHVDSYKEDFDIDKRIIRRAAESQNPEDKTLMWFCRPHGTHCLNENQVFIQGTRDHNTFRFYAEQTYDECVARVIVPKTVKRGKVFGDVFEINYREQAANVAQNSVAPDHDRLTFADGYVLDAPCRSSFNAAMALVGEHGGVKTHQTLPKDADALVEVLSKQKSRRDRLPDALGHFWGDSAGGTLTGAPWKLRIRLQIHAPNRLGGIACRKAFLWICYFTASAILA